MRAGRLLLHLQVASRGPCPCPFIPQPQHLAPTGAAGLFFLLIRLPLIQGELFLSAQLASGFSLKVENEVGSVSSCGASKPVFKHLCDSNYLFLCLFFVSFSLSLLVWHPRADEKAAPSPSSSQPSCLLCSCLPPAPCQPQVLPSPSEAPKPSFLRVLAAWWDGCCSILAAVRQLGLRSVPGSTAA